MLKTLLAAALLALCAGAQAAADQRTFPTPAAAVEALKSALKADDDQALVTIVGEAHKNLVVSGDRASDKARHARAASLLDEYTTLDDRDPNRVFLLVGAQAWPLPVPIVREGSAWRFASEVGAEEMLNRRIGAGERNALTVLRAYVGAQRDYAAVDRNGDGVLQYAQRLASSPGKFDGLYWPNEPGSGVGQSPLGPLIAQSSLGAANRKAGDPYEGYRFRILTRQGPAAPGGAYNYIINGRMLAGFAMVAYPDVPGETGVLTYIVNQNGTVYGKDLGRNTRAIAEKMTTFDPQPGWEPTEF
ncbi:DUF2950 domain-containing protein [Ramlibacter pinisoli]|nr:DUF2950 domain-containing protein [Ramlibacter pinisoli]